jgi:hypothetical protein
MKPQLAWQINKFKRILELGMKKEIRDALRQDKTIDISTTGAQTGQTRRIEIWFHNVDDDIYISGMPGRRDWLANLEAHPEFTFHLKGSLQVDLAASARPIRDENQRRTIMSRFEGERDLEAWVADSPLVHVQFMK